MKVAASLLYSKATVALLDHFVEPVKTTLALFLTARFC